MIYYKIMEKTFKITYFYLCIKDNYTKIGKKRVKNMGFINSKKIIIFIIFNIY